MKSATNKNTLPQKKVITMISNLKDLRLKRCFTQKDLAEAAGVSICTINAIEQENQDILLSLAYKLANILNCSVEELYSDATTVKSITDKVMWFAYATLEVAEEIGQAPRDALRLLAGTGLAERMLSAYPMLHTQGYEYIAEVITELLRAEGVLG